MTADDAYHDVGFAVVACRCGNVWAVDLRYRTSSCTRCPEQADLRKRKRLWEGDDAQDARQAAAAMQAAISQGIPQEDAAEAANLLRGPRPLARHDSPVDAAASKARSITNASARAEAVALWLTRLIGPVDETTFMQGLQKAGLRGDRAEKEIVRMLAMDVIYEPQVGRYACLET